MSLLSIVSLCLLKSIIQNASLLNEVMLVLCCKDKKFSEKTKLFEEEFTENVFSQGLWRIRAFKGMTWFDSTMIMTGTWV